MKKRTLVSIVPVARPHNAIYLQAQMMHRALAPYYDTSPGVGLAKQVAPADVTLVHYGSYDPLAGKLSEKPNAVFLFHGITPARTLLPWNPLVALKATAGYGQLRTLPKNLPWVGLSGSSVGVLKGIGFTRVEESSCVVPQADFNRCGTRVIARSRALLFTGRICPNKGLLELLDLFAHVHDRHPDTLLWIVGARKPGCWYGKMFARRLERHRARKNIVWHAEPLRFAELQELYRTALLYVSCSVHEGFGIPVMEAISWSTPAAYAPCGGTESVWNGLGLLSTRRSEDRAAEIAGLMEDAQARNELLSCQQAILPRFSEASVGERLAHALDRLCA